MYGEVDFRRHLNDRCIFHRHTPRDCGVFGYDLLERGDREIEPLNVRKSTLFVSVYCACHCHIARVRLS